ncbi:HpcH/HpaI aldolase/citrate lyase family protein [Paracoccus sp. (in: a-proteobacteria)]|uniref:HpcH/HpaI aldolase/citrate lyase family protein n=1 Tax=Paracoccus sp. TaxID=267 RepID=UPI003A8A8261
MTTSSIPDETLSFPLFLSAERPDLFAPACMAGTDTLVVDFEDSVAPDSKAAVRRIPESALPRESTVRIFLRVNGTGTRWHRDDVAFARVAAVDGIFLPKSESAEQIAALRALLGRQQKIVALIETVRGLSHVDEIARAADRLAFGSLDLSEDLGCAHTRLALLPLRSRIVQAARLAGRPAPLDGVTVSVEDEAAIRDDAMHASELGFGGKCLIHAAQLAPARAGFAVPPPDLDWVRNALKAEGAALPEAEGALQQSPVAARARRLLLRGKARLPQSHAGMNSCATAPRLPSGK